MLTFLLPLCLSLDPTGAGPVVATGLAATTPEPVTAVAEAAATPDDGQDAVAPEEGAADEAVEESAITSEGEEAAAELDEMRAMEDVIIEPAGASGELRAAVRRLGLGNPLRQRLLDALDELDEAELYASVGPPELPLVTDLSSFDISTVQDRYDIPVEMQPLVARYVQFFQGPGRKWFRKWMSRSTRYIPVMTPILESNGLPRDLVYLAMIESGFSTQAYSWAHASGPWQFINGTGKMFGLRNDFWVDERRDPIKSTVAAARFLRELRQDLGHWYLAWAGYNAGGGRVRHLIERKGTRDFWELSEGRGFATETKHYVPKLIACALVAKNLRAFGFSEDEFDYQPLLEFDVVQVPAPTDLEVLARAAGTTQEVLAELNPELKRWCTPPLPEGKTYALRVPRGQGPVFARSYPLIAPSERLTFRVHKVRGGDTISGIAAAYASAPEAILHLNRLRDPRSLRVSTELIIPVPSGRAAREGRPGAALERQVERARRAGITAARSDEEVPAGTPAPQARNARIHRTAAGETLWSIARQYGLSVADLKRWNRIGNHRALRPGRLLVLAAP